MTIKQSGSLQDLPYCFVVMLHNYSTNIYWAPTIHHAQHDADSQSDWFHNSSNSKTGSILHGTFPSCGCIFVKLFSTHLISALSPKEATPIILIWALEWQQDQHWFASQVRSECVHMTTEETKILFLDKKQQLTSSFLFIFEHPGYLNSTEAENIVRVKAALI